MQACRPVFVFAFRADQAADENGNKDTEEQLHRGKGIGADQTKKHPITPLPMIQLVICWTYYTQMMDEILYFSAHFSKFTRKNPKSTHSNGFMGTF